jgi:hypothetical protein
MAAVESTNGGDERQAKKSQEEGRASEAGLSSIPSSKTEEL